MALKRVTPEVAKAIKEAGYPQDNSGLVYLESPLSIVLTEIFDLYERDYKVGELIHNDKRLSNFKIDFSYAPTYAEVWFWLWETNKAQIEIAKGWDIETLAYVGEGDDARKFVTFGPEDAIIRAINYLVENNLIKA